MSCSTRGWLTIALLATLTAARSVPAESPDPIADPEAWIAEPVLPEFREFFKGDSWTKALDEAKKRLGDLDTLAKSSFPESGSRIMSVTVDGPADKLGMVVGDLISEVDGEPIVTDFRRSQADQPQLLTLVGQDGKARQITIQPGLIGINSIQGVWPERIYLRKGVRNPKWDLFAAIGAAECFSHPGVAETAWHHAFAAGYKADYLSDYCAMQIAWRQGRNADAVAYCARLQTRTGVPESLNVEKVATELALANFKIKQALAQHMAADPSPVTLNDDSVERLQTLLANHLALSPEERRAPSPSLLASYVKSDLIPRIVPILHPGRDDDDFQKNVAKDIRGEHHNYSEKIPTAHYRIIEEKTTVDDPDVELIVHLKVRQHDSVGSQFGRYVTISLLNADALADLANDPNRDPTQKMLLLFIEPAGVTSFRQGTTQNVDLGSVAIDEELGHYRQFIVRLLHTQGRDEIWIDHRRLLYVPAIEHPKRIGFSLQVVGSDVDSRFDFYKLDPNALDNK